MSDAPAAKDVHDYLEERPAWADATAVAEPLMTSMQWRIFALATAGKFFEGLVVFMTGVALPLMVLEFHLGAQEKGVVGAASLFGILVGALSLGGLADRLGRKVMFVAEMVLFIVFLGLLTVLPPNFYLLVACLFGMGLALGCDYPTAHLVISESIASSWRGRLVLAAFGFQAVGALAGTALGFLILSNVNTNSPEAIQSWRLMYGSAIVPAVLVLIGRFFIPESGPWLLHKGRVQQAEQATMRLLQRQPPYPKQVILTPEEHPEGHQPGKTPGIGALFSKKHRKATFLASVPWFLQDLGTYGIGIFTPVIIASTIGEVTKHPRNVAEVVHADMIAAEGAALIDTFLIVGIVCAVILADKVGRIKLQVIGFLGCAVGLFVAALSTYISGMEQIVFVFLGFMIFNFMTNMGPNAMTYLLAGEVFPVSIRGSGAGFAASFAKIGAVMTAFLFPILLADIGTATLLYILSGTSILGALVTWHFGIETRGHRPG